MRRSAAVLLVLLCLSAAAAAQQWTRYSSENGRFVVLLPGNPRTASRDVESKLGKIKLYSYIVDQTGPAYAVMFNDYNVAGQEIDPDKLLAEVQSGMLHAFEDTLQVTRQQRIQIDGYPALWHVAENKTKHVVATLVWASPRLYQVFVVADKDKHDAEASNRFISSFHITRR